jgi:hypothetical protein
MAVGADHIRLSVGRAADVGLGQILCVAVEAGIQYFYGRHQRESAGNGRPASAFPHMTLGRAMATLAAGNGGWKVSRSDALVMRVLIKIEPDVGMADFADLTTEIASGGGSLGTCHRGR